MVIGNDFTWNDGYSWAGSIDDARVYDFGLTEGEIVYIGYGPSGTINCFDHIANLYDLEAPEQRRLDAKDFVMIVDTWLDEILWP